MWTIILLIFSNIFMTFAWYGHLKFESAAAVEGHRRQLGIAFFEYCFQVPANRIGYGRFSPVQLKVIQEIITLTVFGVFATFYFGSHLRWNHAVAGRLSGRRGLLRVSQILVVDREQESGPGQRVSRSSLAPSFAPWFPRPGLLFPAF